MSDWTDIIDSLTDHVSLLKELGERSVEIDPAVLSALGTSAAKAPAPSAPRQPASAEAVPFIGQAQGFAPPAATSALTPEARRSALAEIAARAERFSMVVDDLNAGAQMGGNGISRPGVRRDGNAVTFTDKYSEVTRQRLAVWFKFPEDFFYLWREGHQIAAQALREGAQHFGDEAFAQTGHGPFNAGLRDGLRKAETKFHCHSILLFTRRVGVTEGDRLPAQRHGIGKSFGVETQRLSAGHISFGRTEKFRTAGIAY